MLSERREGKPRPAAIERAAMGFVRTLESATRTEDVAREFGRALGQLGFSHALAARLPSSGIIGEATIFSNTFPTLWTEEYLAKGYMKSDAVLSEMLKRYKPLAWSDVIEARDLTDSERRVLHLSVQHGLDCGFIVPVFETSGRNGFVNMAGTGATLSDVDRWALALIATKFFHRMMALDRRRLGKDVPLSDREIEVLKWIATGKSDWQIGQILDLSSKTINYHVENVKRKYDVATRMQAVVKAIRLGKLPE